MPTFKLTVAYDGTGLVGWQRQASGTSVQGLLEDALRELDDRHSAVIGAGRTDAGVHALGQVASVTLARAVEPDVLQRAVNARLPPSVRILSAAAAPEDFHARFGAVSKTYRYRLWHGDVISPFERLYAWHVTGRLDLERLAAAAMKIDGRHDFAAFQAAGSSVDTTVREIYSSRMSMESFGVLRVPRGGELLLYEVTGNGFLRHMVRTIVGTLVEIGRGRRPPDWIDDLLASRDRADAGPTAPAEGLFLVGVDYDRRP